MVPAYAYRPNWTLWLRWRVTRRTRWCLLCDAWKIWIITITTAVTDSCFSFKITDYSWLRTMRQKSRRSTRVSAMTIFNIVIHCAHTLLLIIYRFHYWTIFTRTISNTNVRSELKSRVVFIQTRRLMVIVKRTKKYFIIISKIGPLTDVVYDRHAVTVSFNEISNVV